MPSPNLDTFDGLYLEDSYFLGMVADGARLRLRVLFAVESGHPSYSPPKIGEQHCYREGDVVIDGFKSIKWSAGDHPSIMTDPDGSLDLGDIAFGIIEQSYWIQTAWFETTFEASAVIAVIDDEAR